MTRKLHSARPSASKKAGRSAGVKSARMATARMAKEAVTSEPVKAVKRVIKKAASSLREMVHSDAPARRKSTARKVAPAARGRATSRTRTASSARSRKAA